MAAQSIASQRQRSALTALGIAVGIAAVMLLTAIGEGVQRFILAEFTQFGTHLLAVKPGKANTFGISGAVVGNTKPLTLEDAEALARLPEVEAAGPFLMGNARVEAEAKARRVSVLGVGAEAARVWQMSMASGRFLPADATRATARAYAVLGAKVREELFGQANPLGQRIRVGGERYRVIGVMERKGQVLGYDMDDSVYIPATKALTLFNREGLMEIDILYFAEAAVGKVEQAVKRLLLDRHGRQDFTIVTQTQMLEVLDGILGVLTFAVGGLGAISLVVGGVGIFTIMTIALAERASEIGLLAALGATRGQILGLFLGEAVLLAAAGGVLGLLLGVGGAGLLAALAPRLPLHFSWQFTLMAEGVALLVGLAAGVWPARQAAGLNPVEALRAE